MKKIISFILVVITCVSLLSGCSTLSLADDVASYQLVPQLTMNEIIEYYAESMSFDAVVTKNIEVDRTTYETKDVVDETKRSQIENAVRNTESLLKEMEYKYSDKNIMALEESTFHYIKAYLNDLQLTNGSIQSIKQALGYYFVDVSYKIQGRDPGTFTNQASMVGLNGAFIHSEYFGTDSIDSAYMTQAVEKLNDYYTVNKITDKRASYNNSTGLFSTSKEQGIVQNMNVMQQPVVQNTSDVENTENVNENIEGITDENNQNDENKTQIAQQQTAANTVWTERSPQIDANEFNTIVGSSIKQTAYMPQLKLVYNIPSSTGNISGIGLYPSGLGGLTKFGFDRQQLDGSIIMRYVYKEDLDDMSILWNTNIYPVFTEISTGYSSSNDNTIPEFLMIEFEKLIERADRAIVNTDLSALMSGDIFSDMGAALLKGYKSQYTNVLRQISTIRRVINRDVENNCYLVEVESQIQEGPKNIDLYGTYRDKSYVVIEQVGQKFVITDWLTITREMQTEPDINPDSAVTKRLVALNLTGEVTDNVKAEAEQLLNELYTASTYRILNATEEEPKQIQAGDGVINITKGMYDCFNNDVEMLSSTKKESINSKLRSKLVQHGTATPAQLSGIVTEWIGGAQNQVEFTTEEVITYTGRNDGIYMNCYYLMSKMNDVWVIDDLQVLMSEERSGDAFQSDVNRIRQ